jgi:parallel beta-helix repeat protein
VSPWENAVTKRNNSRLRILVLLSVFLAGTLFVYPAASDRTVKDFGAKGDGIADDTEALQRAVDSGIRNLHLPAGVYRIRKTIQVELDKTGPISVAGFGTARLLMTGPGPAIRLVGTHTTGTAAPSTVKEQVWERQRMPLLDSLEIVGAHDEAAGIEVTGTMQAIFTRLLIRSTLHGIRLAGRNRNVIISECHIYNNRGIGVFLDGAELHQINITNSHISYNRMGGIVSLNSVIRNLQIGSSDIEDNVGSETEFPSNILIDARGGSVVEGAVVGCTLQHSAGPRTANFRIIGESKEKSGRAGNFTVADNVLSDVGINIHLKNARGVTITGNTFWQASRYNLLVEGSSNIVVGPNLFDRSPHYQSQDPNAILFKDSEDCTLTGLHVNQVLSAPAGLVLEDCRWVNVSGCTLLDNEGAGIVLQNSENCFITGCLIRMREADKRRAVAIRAVAGKGNRISGNFLDGRVEIKGGGTKVNGNNRVKAEKHE